MKDPSRPPVRLRWRRRLPPLPLALRVTLHALGAVLVLVGIAGLALPGIQGVLTLLAGAAVLSLASDAVHRWMRGLMGRWPGVWKRFEKLRRRLHRRLSPPGE